MEEAGTSLRIAMVAACPLPWPRGTPIRIHRMAEALTERGHEVHAVTYPLGDARVPVPYALHRVGRVHRRDDGRPGPTIRKLVQLDPLLVRGIVRLARATRLNVIHAHHYEGLLAALCARELTKLPPIVFDMHTLLQSELPHYRLGLPRSWVASIGRALDRRLPPRADHVIAVSEGIRAALVADGRLADARVDVVPNGLEAENFRDAETRDSGARRTGGSRVVFAGNLAEYQGVDLLLQSFAILQSRRRDVRLELLTDSPFTKHAALARSLGILASIDVDSPSFADLPARLSAADVLVNPRVSCSGLPQKLLNYMAAGRPIVSFAGSANVLEHGRTALVVADGDVAGFASAVESLLDRPSVGRELATNARRQVLAEHSWSQVAQRIERVYARLVRASAPDAPDRAN